MKLSEVLKERDAQLEMKKAIDHLRTSREEEDQNKAEEYWRQNDQKKNEDHLKRKQDLAEVNQYRQIQLVLI